MGNNIYVENKFNNEMKVSNNNVLQSEKRAEEYAEIAKKCSQDCAGYLSETRSLLSNSLSAIPASVQEEMEDFYDFMPELAEDVLEIE